MKKLKQKKKMILLKKILFKKNKYFEFKLNYLFFKINNK